MKKLLGLIVVAILGIGTAFAQNNGGRPPRMSVEDQVNNLKQELKLSDEQTAKVTVIYTNFHKKMEEARNNGTGFEQMRSEMEKVNASLDSVFTPEQKEAYQKLMQERMQRRGGPGPRN
jgi:phage shock protein A